MALAQPNCFFKPNWRSHVTSKFHKNWLLIGMFRNKMLTNQ